MLCIYCDSKMMLDDKDVHENFTEFYYECNRCAASCVVKRNRDKTTGKVGCIPHRCSNCRHSLSNSGDECNLAHYTSESNLCLSWEWNGKLSDEQEVRWYEPE